MSGFVFVDETACGEAELLVKVDACAVCGTDDPDDFMTEEDYEALEAG